MKGDIPNIHTALWELDGFASRWASRLSIHNIYTVEDLAYVTDLTLENIPHLAKKHIPAIRQAQANFMATIPTGSALSKDFKVLADAIDFYNRFHFPVSRCICDVGSHVHHVHAYKNWQALFRVYALAHKEERDSPTH